MKNIVISIENGELSFVYDDDLADLLQLGEATVERVSHVEPYDGSGGEPFALKHAGVWWTADMRPVDGPVLGPFPLRDTALAAELAWLREHRGL